nr:DUF2690 domain-containing protein [Micromonospora sp. DSM 115978]
MDLRQAAHPRIWRVLAPIAVACLTASVLVATPANAATCSGYGCDGTDPIDTGCSSGAQNATRYPRYIMDGNKTVAMVELRWSPSCKTNWGKISNYVQRTNEVKVHVYRVSPQATTPEYGGTGEQYYGDQLNGDGMTVCAVGKVKTPSRTITAEALCF